MRDLSRGLLGWIRLNPYRIDIFIITGVANILTSDICSIGHFWHCRSMSRRQNYARVMVA